MGPIRRSRQNSGIVEKAKKQSTEKSTQRELRIRSRTKKNEILSNSHSLTINQKSDPDDEIIEYQIQNSNSSNLDNNIDRLSTCSPKGSSYASSDVANSEADLKIPEK